MEKSSRKTFKILLLRSDTKTANVLINVSLLVSEHGLFPSETCSLLTPLFVKYLLATSSCVSGCSPVVDTTTVITFHQRLSRLLLVNCVFSW